MLVSKFLVNAQIDWAGIRIMPIMVISFLTCWRNLLLRWAGSGAVHMAGYKVVGLMLSVGCDRFRGVNNLEGNKLERIEWVDGGYIRAALLSE